MNVTKKAGVKPTKFSDLKIEELRRTAMADFAVQVEPTDNEKTVLAALLEGGVEWGMYVEQHPELFGVVEDEDNNVVTSEDVTGRSGASSKPEVAKKIEIIVEEEEPLTAKKYLIKMTRANPLYQIRGYEFKSTHPYALVDPEDVDAILEEEGFRQAKPSEVREFYELDS